MDHEGITRWEYEADLSAGRLDGRHIEAPGKHAKGKRENRDN